MRLLGALSALALMTAVSCKPTVRLRPSNGQRNVNVDTHLDLSFSSPPTIGSSGLISVYDESNGKLVDALNLSIPVSPSPFGNGSTDANYSDTTTYQTNIIGGMDFYFYPIIVHGNTATVYLHNNKLDYGKTYRVEMDPSVFQLASGTFKGFSKESPWTFSTKAHGPTADASRVVVDGDGSADFNTVQGAIDWAPSESNSRVEIYIRNGNYTELVYFQYKSNLTLRGQSRTKVIVGYPNNSAFNPPNRQGPSRRPAFSFHGVADVQLSSFTINNYYTGQAEALLVEGIRVVLDQMTLHGSGDAFTTYGQIYVSDSILTGDGDTILGYGSVFWVQSRIESSGPISWTRTGQGVHGNVFVNCTFIGIGNTTFARLPDNTGGVAPNWPYAEFVTINSRTKGIDPVGWGPVQGPPFDTSNLHLWEYNTMDLNGNPIDMPHRLNVSRQLKLPQDANIVREYQDPSYVLGGWDPTIV